MTKVDWTKAPEGATHYDPECPGGECWHMYDDGQWFVWIGDWDDCDDWATSANIARLIPRPITQSSKQSESITIKAETILTIQTEYDNIDSVYINGKLYAPVPDDDQC